MFTDLIEAQKENIKKYRDDWVRYGLSTMDCNHEEAEKWFDEAYKTVGLKPPKIVLWYNSPIDIIKAHNALEASFSEIMSNRLSDPISLKIRWGISRGLSDTIRDVTSKHRDFKVISSLKNCVIEELSRASWRSDWKDDWFGMKRCFHFGSFNVPIISMYGFYCEILKLKSYRGVLPLVNIARNCGWWVPYRNMVLVSERPSVINFNSRRLHKEGTPIFKYRDGFGLWALNGVRVSRKIAETPWHKLHASILFKEQNTEVRREIVRKIGVEKICEDLKAESIDKFGNYELLLLDLKDGLPRPYLKMLNPSIGVYHIEGVHTECDTVEKALNWRNATSVTPKVIT